MKGFLKSSSLFQSSSSVLCHRPSFVLWALWHCGWNPGVPFSFATAGRLRHQGALRRRKGFASASAPGSREQHPSSSASPTQPQLAPVATADPRLQFLQPWRRPPHPSHTVRHTSTSRQRTSPKIRFQHQGSFLQASRFENSILFALFPQPSGWSLLLAAAISVVP